MTKTLSKKIQKLMEAFFSHDVAARSDEKIIDLFYYFKSLDVSRLEERDLKDLLAFSGYGLFWSIVEYMHKNDLSTDKINVLADYLRINKEFLKTILDEFKLFRVENNCYISDRILRNKEYRETKAEQNQNAAKYRWLLSTFYTAYEKEFGEKPILAHEEIEKLKKYNQQIEDLRSKLPDILYTLKNLKFDADITFKPCANWLLSKNNLARLINGEFGKLKHRKTEKEIADEKEKADTLATVENAPNEIEIDIELETISSKAEAIDLIAQKYSSNSAKGLIVSMIAKPLMKRFDITKKEIERCRKDA